MKNISLILTFVFLMKSGFCQIVDGEKMLRTKDSDTTSGWKKGGMFNTGFSQTSLTNWAAGGAKVSTTINGFLSLYANYRKKSNSWYNSLEIGYGGMKEWQIDNTKTFRKTDDKIDFTSKYGRKAFLNWYYASLLNFRTQTSRGYNNPTDNVSVSDFMAPGYVLFSMGIDYQYKSIFSLYFAPVTSKMTFVRNQRLADAGAYGVDKAEYQDGIKVKDGKQFRGELGGYMRISFAKDIMKNITLQTKADFFSNYTQKPENIDIMWETLLTMKVNKYIGVTISTQLIYDDDIIIKIDKNKDGNYNGEGDIYGPRVQFKEILGVGFTYKF